MKKSVPHKVWAEQDDRVSRLMLQIGDDQPVTLLRYDRSLPQKFDTITAVVLNDTGVELGGELIGILVEWQPSEGFKPS